MKNEGLFLVVSVMGVIMGQWANVARKSATPYHKYENIGESERIEFLRLFLVALLVLLHFGAIYGSTVPSTIGYAGQEFAIASIFVSFVNFLGYTAVPTLSVVSGYLFFRGADKNTPPAFQKKIIRRLKSLVLPFLLWSGAYVLLAYGLFSINNNFYDTTFAPADGNIVRSISDAWLGVHETPLAIQLWFVRDLIVTITVSPVIWLLVGRMPVPVLGALFLLWLTGHDLWIFQKLDVVGFFCVGAAFSMHGWNRHLPDRFALPILLVFMVLVFCRTITPAFLEDPANNHGLYIATCLMRILGVIAIWSAAPLLMTGGVRSLTANFSHLAFFIHCAHFPPILYIKMALGGVLDPQSNLMQLFIYFASAILIFVSMVICARILQAIMPGLFSILSGGRSAPLTGNYRRVPV